MLLRQVVTIVRADGRAMGRRRRMVFRATLRAGREEARNGGGLRTLANVPGWSTAIITCLMTVAPAGCGGGGLRATERPDVIRLSIVEAIVGPGRMDGTPWDPPGRAVPNEVFEELGIAAESPDPVSATREVLASSGAARLTRPDVEGSARVSVDGGPYERALEIVAEADDTFTPQFRGPPSWQALPFEGPLSVSIELRDRDAGGDADDVASVVVGDEDLLAAVGSGRPHHVSFGDQTNRQLLFVGILAARSR